ncbi:MAG: acyl-CoA dehydrogenase [Burkholderiales bacterium RIFCSPHIGHO2_12_FULL_69_20]|nr:MAG: acyl-CoA dehydrogenase [Burkholderiales bacterium RIFCSPHIGHO2_12_FULL_69_20]
MPLILSEEQTMLRDSARDFLAEQAPVSQLRGLRDSNDATGFSRSLWQQFAEMGFTGVLVPEAQGGLGLGHVEAGVVMEQIGHQLCASPLLASGIVAATALRQAGSGAQQAAWLPKIASGQAIATLAVDEAAKHRPQRLATQARAEGGGWVLDGAKTLVLDGHVADLLIVAARVGEAGTGLFLVDPKASGVTVERTVMVDAHNAARVRLQGLKLAADALLGTPETGAAALDATLDAGRCAAAAELIGLADEVFERTVAYIKERKQFGKLIGEFQGLQHRAATLYCDLEISRAALIKAQQALDADIAGATNHASSAVAIAKARAGRSATTAVQEGVQMHGGMGMTDAFEIGFFMKRARVLQELWGDSNFHFDALAQRRGY